MRKLVIVIYLSCIVFFTILFPSTTWGDEQSQEVQYVFGREPREAGRKPGNFAREDTNSSDIKKSGKTSKKANTKKNSNAKKEREKNRNKGGNSKKKSNSPFTKREKSKKKSQNSRKRKQNKSNKNGCSRQTSNFCPIHQALSLRHLYNQVYNFNMQLNRTQKQANLVEKKRKKKDEFQKDVAILTDVVGGNLNNPTCSAKSRSASSAGSTGLTLANCNTTIATSCETINSTLTGTCLDTMKTFESKTKACRISGTCTCWMEASRMKGDIAKCSMEKEAKEVKSKKKTCTDIFAVCKKAQDSAVKYTATCPSKNSSTTAMSTATTTKSARRRNIVEKFLARKLMRRSHQNAIRAWPSRITVS